MYSDIINILIPDGESHFTLSVIHSLYDHKEIHIHLVSAKRWTESKLSNRIKSFSYFRKTGTEMDFVNHLMEVIRTKSIHVIMPIEFDSIRLISKYKHNFNDLNVKSLVSSVTSLDIANNKWKLYDFLRKNEFSTPLTTLIKGHKIYGFDSEKYPLISKPLSRWNGNGIKIIEDKDELITSLKNRNKNEDYIIQEFIRGKDFCVNVLCSEGNILAYTIQKGVLANSNQFKSHLGSKFILNKELISTVERMMKELNWSGFANFDIILNESDHKFYFIEINPRVWGSLEASTFVGVNFPYLMCLACLNIKLENFNYKLTKFYSNRGVLKLLNRKLLFKKQSLNQISNNVLKYDLKDPAPKIFKYSKKIIKKFY